MNLSIISADFTPYAAKQPFSVCITVKNEAPTITNFLQSLFSQSLPPDEIVIVDGGSEDRTRFLISAIGDVRINLMHVDCSPAKGRNIAVRAARHQTIVFVDAGTVLDKNLFANLVGPMSDGVDLVAGIYMPIQASKWAQYFIPDWKNTEALQNTFLPSCRNVAIRKSLFQKVGGFPADLQQRWGEDTEFMTRAKRVSQSWILNKNAVVFWEAPTTKDDSCKLAYRYGMGNGEIGCDTYVEGYVNSQDPVMVAAYEGYKAGCEIRKASK
jgi:glycosyltransferase involved in cell wall biosynthesis